jgi:hypothetical protein
MKNFILLIFAFLFLCECKHEDYVPDCVCSNLTVVGEFGTQEGRFFFPNGISFKTYSVEPKRLFAGGVSTRYIICTDSVLLKQIKDKQIKDSSQVIMTGVGSGISGYCNIFLQRMPIFIDPLLTDGPNVIRITTIDKK